MTTDNSTQNSPELKEAVKATVEFNTPAQELQISDEVQPPAIVETQSTQVMNALVTQLNSGNLAPEQLGMVLDAQERVLDRQARQDFAIAMAECQAEMPNILKTEYNPQTKSSFESIDGLNKVLTPVMTDKGFSVSFGTDDCPVEDSIRITAELAHRGGWTKNYHYDLPYDLVGIKGNQNKTKIHASGSTLKYGRRYLLKLIFNLTTVDEKDDDGNANGQGEVEAMSYEIERLKKVGAAIIVHCGIINIVKYGIEIEMLADASESWFNLTNDEKKSLWVAPSKGGAFTTAERKVMQTTEFRRAHMSEEAIKEEIDRIERSESGDKK